MKWKGEDNSSLIHRLGDPTTRVNQVGFSSENNLMASCTCKDLQLWNFHTWDLQWSHNSSVFYTLCFSFSPDGKYLVTGDSDKKIRIWDSMSRDLIITISDRPYYLKILSFSPDGMYLAGGSWDSNIYLWNTHTWSLIHILSDHQNSILCVSFTPDNAYIVSGAIEWAFLFIWDTHSGEHLQSIYTNSFAVLSTAFSLDGSLFACGCNHRSTSTLHLFDPPTWKPFCDIRIPSLSILSLQFSLDGHYLVASMASGKIYLVDLFSAYNSASQQCHVLPVNSIALSPNNRFLATGSNDCNIKIWDFSLLVSHLF